MPHLLEAAAVAGPCAALQSNGPSGQINAATDEAAVTPCFAKHALMFLREMLMVPCSHPYGIKTRQPFVIAELPSSLWQMTLYGHFITSHCWLNGAELSLSLCRQPFQAMWSILTLCYVANLISRNLRHQVVVGRKQGYSLTLGSQHC